mgnify:CR=1 FL=1
MLNVKQTLKNLHKKLPTLSLDDLFDVLDCYVEQSTLSTFPNWEPPTKIYYSTDKTTSVSETPKINCITSKNVDPAIYTIANCTDGKIKFYDGGGSTQLVANH